MFIDPTEESIQQLFTRGLTGSIAMLNLLRFRDEADYSTSPHLAPSEPISGREAYNRYGALAMRFVVAAGAEVVFMGEGGSQLIGPSEERWDEVLLVRYPDLNAFLGMTQAPEYQSILGHRTAALADSRLLPMVERNPGVQGA